MAFTQRDVLNPEEVKTVLQNELNLPIAEVVIDFQSKGSTGNVNKVEIKSNNASYSYILKKVDDYDYFSLYEKVLEPWNLNHPKIYSKIKIGSSEYLLMQFIEAIESDWDIKHYKKAIEWLVNKDSLIEKRLDEFSSYDFIGKEIKSSVKEHFEVTIPRAVDQKIHEIVDQEFLSQMLAIKDILYKKSAFLNSGLKTLCHIDFCTNNIIFEKNTENIYVIDWCWPQIGTVCLDLAELLKEADSETEESCIEIYRKALDFDDFDQTYNALKDIQDFSQLGWMLKAHMKNTLSLDTNNLEKLVEKVVKNNS